MSAIASGADPNPLAISQRHRRPKLERGEITLNLVAMLDMAFNILIFFILAANFAVNEGVLTAKMPAGPGGGIPPMMIKPPAVDLTIELTNVGNQNTPMIRIVGDTRPLSSFGDLRERLEQLQLNPASGRHGLYTPDNPIVIKARPGTRWNDAVNAFNAAVGARYAQVSFADSTAE